MAIKSYKPTTNGRRNMTVLVYKNEITCDTPEKSLLQPLKGKGGRNNLGRITVRHKGGAEKRKYRVIDFLRNKDNIPATVKTVEYDPNRSANIALVVYADGEKRYIIAPKGIKVGTQIFSGKDVDIKVGNALPLENIPVGTMIHNIEMQPGKGGQIARAAGMSAQIMARDEKYVTIKMPSGEMRYILAACKATIGQVGNLEHEIIRIGKAGKTRYLGVRPTVRGVVMNPCDHPHGGGEGKSPIGMPGPVTPWGKPALGYKTRKHKKASNKLIITRIN